MVCAAALTRCTARLYDRWAFCCAHLSAPASLMPSAAFSNPLTASVRSGMLTRAPESKKPRHCWTGLVTAQFELRRPGHPNPKRKFRASVAQPPLACSICYGLSSTVLLPPFTTQRPTALADCLPYLQHHASRVPLVHNDKQPVQCFGITQRISKPPPCDSTPPATDHTPAHSTRPDPSSQSPTATRATRYAPPRTAP